MPAKLAGSWRLMRGELTLAQQCQLVTGAMKTGDGISIQSTNGVHGAEITRSGDGREMKDASTANTIEFGVRA